MDITNLRFAFLATGLCFILVASVQATLALPQPVLHWDFEEAPGSDTSLDGVSGTEMQLNAGRIEQAGYRGNALFIPRSGTRPLAPGTASAIDGEQWTISLWYRQRNQTTTGSRLRVLASFGNAGFLDGVSMSVERGNGSNLQFRVGSSEEYFPFPWGLGWHHAVMVRDGSEVRCYIDGKLLGTLPASSPSLSDLRLGGDFGLDTSRFYNGYIDDVKIFDGALSSEQVEALHRMHPLPPVVSIPYTSGFAGGDTPYHCFRIPSALVAADGTVLAFAEARTGNCSDTGDIDMVVRRSHDGGKTWGPIKVVWDDGPNTAGNPVPLLDRDTGRIWMIMTRNLGQDTQSAIQAGTSEGGRTVWATYSDDHGVNWVQPYEISDAVKEPHWRWYATGPGVSIQAEDGTFFVPATKNTGGGELLAFSFVFWSRDHGITWERGGLGGPRVSEAQVVELTDGELMLNTRRVGNVPLYRSVLRSTDRGQSWGPVEYDLQLPSSGVQGSLLRYTLGARQDQDRIVFSNPANNTNASANSRTRMTVRVSLNEGESWAYSRELYSGWSAYSSLTVLDDFRIGNLYEWGEDARYERFLFEVMTLDWLSNGEQVTPEVPLPPENVSALHDSGLNLVSWDASDTALEYHVYRYQMGTEGAGSRVATVPADDLLFMDEEIEAGSGYHYRVLAANDVGQSATSSSDFVSTREDDASLVPCRFPTISGALLFAPDTPDVRVRSDYTDPSHGIEVGGKSFSVRSYNQSYTEPVAGAVWFGQAGEDSGRGWLAHLTSASLNVEGFSHIASTNGSGFLIGGDAELHVENSTFDGFAGTDQAAVLTEDGAANPTLLLSGVALNNLARGVWLRNITGESQTTIAGSTFDRPSSYGLEFRTGPGEHGLEVRDSTFRSDVARPVRLYAFGTTDPTMVTRNSVEIKRSLFVNDLDARAAIVIGGVEESAGDGSTLDVLLDSCLIDLRGAAPHGDSSGVLSLPESSRRSNVIMNHCSLLLSNSQHSALFLQTPDSHWTARNLIVDGQGVAFRNNSAGVVSVEHSLLNVTTPSLGAGDVSVGSGVLTGLDPKFADRDAGDFSLQPGSPAIGAGIRTESHMDLLGNTRPYPNTMPDLGAIELQKFFATGESLIVF